MAELDFMVPAQVTVGAVTMDVEVKDASTVFIDHEDYVHIILGPPKASLAEDPRVRRNEAAIIDAVSTLAISAATILIKRRGRAQQMRGGA